MIISRTEGLFKQDEFVAWKMILENKLLKLVWNTVRLNILPDEYTSLGVVSFLPTIPNLGRDIIGLHITTSGAAL